MFRKICCSLEGSFLRSGILPTDGRKLSCVQESLSLVSVEVSCTSDGKRMLYFMVLGFGG
jgi:hypothetical protein